MLEAWAAVMGVNGPVGKMAEGALLASAGRDPSGGTATTVAWPGFACGAVGWVLPVLAVEGDEMSVLEAGGLEEAMEEAPGGMAQPESQAITAIRQIDVNFMGKNWLSLDGQR